MSKKKKTQKQQQEPLMVVLNETVLEVIEGQEEETKVEITKVEEVKDPNEETKVEDQKEELSELDKWFTKENLQDTIDLIKSYKNVSIESVIADVDLASEEKVKIASFYNVMGWIEDVHQVILISILNNEWEIANNLLIASATKWKLLRKLFGNWEQIRDKRQLKEFSLKIFKDDPKAITTLNKWAIEYSKSYNLLVKGYCDLCCQDAKIFILQNSEV
jgi:hypothetical protein